MVCEYENFTMSIHLLLFLGNLLFVVRIHSEHNVFQLHILDSDYAKRTFI